MRRGGMGGGAAGWGGGGGGGGGALTARSAAEPGTINAPPQFGHLTRLPAVSSLELSLFPHWHTKAMGMVWFLLRRLFFEYRGLSPVSATPLTICAMIFACCAI